MGFWELLLILTSRAHVDKCAAHISILSCCVRVINNLKLQCNNRAIVHWICNMHLKDHMSTDSLLEKLGINKKQTLLQYN